MVGKELTNASHTAPLPPPPQQQNNPPPSPETLQILPERSIPGPGYFKGE